MYDNYMLYCTNVIGKELIKLLNHDSIKNIKLSSSTSSSATSSGTVVGVVGVHDRPSGIVNSTISTNTTVIDIV